MKEIEERQQYAGYSGIYSSQLNNRNSPQGMAGSRAGSYQSKKKPSAKAAPSSGKNFVLRSDDGLNHEIGEEEGIINQNHLSKSSIAEEVIPNDKNGDDQEGDDDLDFNNVDGVGDEIISPQVQNDDVFSAHTYVVKPSQAN